jgi:hypothetical protein
LQIKENLRKVILNLKYNGNIKFIAGQTQKYRIEMKNEYLNPEGSIVKRQKLNSVYSRTLSSVLAPFVALVEYRWESVEFSSEPDKAPIRWKFAAGLSFPNYLFSIRTEQERKFLAQEKVYTKIIKHCESFQSLYQELPKLPSVYLLIMHTFDALSFDAFASAIYSTPKLFENPGVEMELRNLSHQQTGLGLGMYNDASFFKNGVFNATFLGYGKYQHHTCLIFEYYCNESKVKISEKDLNTGRSREGHSYYSGLLYLDSITGLPVMGTMLETYVAVQNKTNNVGLPKVPVHIRRYIKCELLG